MLPLFLDGSPMHASNATWITAAFMGWKYVTNRSWNKPTTEYVINLSAHDSALNSHFSLDLPLNANAFKANTEMI